MSAIHRLKALEMAMAAAGRPNRCLTDLMGETQCRRPGLVTEISAQTRAWCSSWFLDLALDARGNVALIEANASNAQLSVLCDDGDDTRINHLVDQFQAGSRPGTCVLTFSYSPDTILVAEAIHRAEQVASRLGAVLRHAGEEIGNENITVVADSIPRIAPHVTRDHGTLFFRGRSIELMSNPNLLPELVRTGVIERSANSGYNIDTRICAEGHAVPLAHDKIAQQVIAGRVGFREIACRTAHTTVDLVSSVRSFTDSGRAAILKPAAASGGCGVRVLPPSAPLEEIRTEIQSLEKDARAKYGDNWKASCLPIQVFEFFQSQPFPSGNDGYLWDWRWQVLVRPGRVAILPAAIRICPAPFDGTNFSRDSVVNNVTGRPVDGRRLFRGDDARILDAIGIGDRTINHVHELARRWAEEAEGAVLAGGVMMANPGSVIVIGSANVDLFLTVDRLPVIGETLVANHTAIWEGGKGLNAAVASVRSCASTRFVARVGDDPFGKRIIGFARSAGIDVENVRLTPGASTGIATITSVDGDNAIIVAGGANRYLEPEDTADVAISLADVVLVSCEVPAMAIAALLRRAHARGARTVINPSPVMEDTRPLLDEADFVILNSIELQMLGGSRAPNSKTDLDWIIELTETIQRSLRHRPGFVVTLGPAGIVVIPGTDDPPTFIPAFPANVVDTTGAGDTVAGATAARLVCGNDLVESVRFAAAAASITVESFGAAPGIPIYADTVRRLESNLTHPRATSEPDCG